MTFESPRNHPQTQTQPRLGKERVLRLLLLTSDYSPGTWSGIGVAVAGQAKALARLGHEVHVALADDLGCQCPPLPALQANHEPHVHPLGRRRFPLDPAAFDAVHLHSIRLAPIALELKRRFGLPLITTVHGFVEYELPNAARWSPWATLQRRVLAASDRVIVLSPSEAALAAQMRLPAERVRTIGNGISAHDARDSRDAETATRDGQPGGPIVFAGRFAGSKGIGLAERLARRLMLDQGTSVVFAGGHGDDAGARAVARLTSLASRGSDFEAVAWLPRPTLQALYRRAKLVIVPSRYEPFGLTALEAQATAVPVLAADVGGLRQTVPKRARLTSRHADDWAAAAVDLLEDQQRSRALVTAAQRKIAGLTWQHIATRLTAEYHLLARTTLARSTEGQR